MSFLSDAAVGWFVANWTVNIFFFCDLIMSFFLAYQCSDDQGSSSSKQQWVTEPRAIKMHCAPRTRAHFCAFAPVCTAAPLRASLHRCVSAPLRLRTDALLRCTDLRTWFVIDLLTVIDFQLLARAVLSARGHATFCLICQEGGDDGMDIDALRLVRTLRLFRLVKLLRILRASRIITRWQDFYGFSYATLTLIRLLTTLALLLHWFTCLWAMCALQGMPGVAMNDLETWVQASGLQEYADDGQAGPIYLVSLYVSVVALFGGIGSIGPNNLIEYAVLTIILFTGCFFWAYVISSITSMLSTLDPHITAFRHTMDELNHFMAENEFSQGHRVRIRRFFRATQDHVRKADSRFLLNKMSDRLKGDTALLIGVQVLNKVWYFNLTVYDIEKGYLASVALALENCVYEPKEKFPLEDLTVVTTGMCCVKLRIMKRGAVMGLDCLIPERRAALREGTDQFAACLRFVETASISRSSLMATARSFPKAHAHLKRVEIKITLRAAIRAVIRIMRAEKLELRISTFKRKLWRQATETDVTQFAGLTLHKALGRAGKHVSKAAGEVVNMKGNLAGLLTIGEQPAAPKAAEPPALLPAFAPGDRVMHDKRGPGTVSEVTDDALVRITFDNGESHRYGAKSWAKLKPLSASSSDGPHGVTKPIKLVNAGAGVDLESAMAAGFASVRAELAHWHEEQLKRMEQLEAALARVQRTDHSPVPLNAQDGHLGEQYLQVHGTIVTPSRQAPASGGMAGRMHHMAERMHHGHHSSTHGGHSPSKRGDTGDPEELKI